MSIKEAPIRTSLVLTLEIARARMLQVLLLVLCGFVAIVSADSHKCAGHRAGNPLSFDELQQNDCLPEDFSLGEEGDEVVEQCWMEAAESGDNPRRRIGRRPGKMVQLRRALECLLDEMEMEDDEGNFDSDTMMEYIDEWTSNSTWRQQQKQQMQMCQVMMENGLTGKQQGMFMMVCLRGVMMLNCRRENARHQAGRGAEDMTNIAAGMCLDKVKPVHSTIAVWGACTVREAIDMGRAQTIMESLQEYRDYEHDVPSEDVEFLKETTDKIRRAVHCTMHGNGEAYGNIVNFNTVKDHIRLSEGPEYAKQMRLAVVEECEQMGAETVTDMTECWWQIAPLACVAGKSYMVLGKHMHMT